MSSYSRIIMFTVTIIAGTSLTPALSEEKSVLPWALAVLSSCCVPGNRVSLGHGPASCSAIDVRGTVRPSRASWILVTSLAFTPWEATSHRLLWAEEWQRRLHYWQTLWAPWGVDHLQGSLQPGRSKETQEEAPTRVQREMMAARAVAGEVARGEVNSSCLCFESETDRICYQVGGGKDRERCESWLWLRGIYLCMKSTAKILILSKLIIIFIKVIQGNRIIWLIMKSCSFPPQPPLLLSRNNHFQQF